MLVAHLCSAVEMIMVHIAHSKFSVIFEISASHEGGYFFFPLSCHCVYKHFYNSVSMVVLYFQNEVQLAGGTHLPICLPDLTQQEFS